MLNDADWLVHEAAELTAKELGEQAPTEHLVARLHDENVFDRATAHMPYQQSDPDVIPLLPLALQRAIQTEVIGDRYQLQDPIGRGGMATIYRG